MRLFNDFGICGIGGTPSPTTYVYTLTENGNYTAVNAGIYLTQLNSITDYFATTYQKGY